MSPVPDWTRLQPHRPIDPGELGYIDRPDSADVRIADWLLAGRSPVLVAGPVGIGKSTELVHAGDLLRKVRVVVLAQLDRMENMRSLTTDQALRRLADRLVDVATKDLKLEVSDELLERIRTGIPQRSQDLALAAIREVKRLAQIPLALLIDGLEKCTEHSFRQVLDALTVIEEHADLAVVVPWIAAYGPTANSVIGPREKLVVIRPVTLEGTEPPGVKFLGRLAGSRLGLPSGTSLPAEFYAVAARCAYWSGGIPRTFLQLLADACSYARLLRSENWPRLEDVDRAVSDQRDSFRRLMLPGDETALRTVDDTDGRELELGTKLRLLSHGMLLEHAHMGGAPVLRPHPIVRQLLVSGAAGD